MSIFAWWATLSPAIKEPIKSAVVASAFSVQTAFLVLVGAAAQAGAVGSPGDLIGYIGTHWWGTALAFILPAAYRARQGFNAATSPPTQKGP